MAPKPPHPDAVPRLIGPPPTATIERNGWFYYVRISEGIAHFEKSGMFAFTRRGAERKGRRWVEARVDAREQPRVVAIIEPLPRPVKPSPMIREPRG